MNTVNIPEHRPKCILANDTTGPNEGWKDMTHHGSQRAVSRRSVLKHGVTATAIGLTGISAASGVTGARQCDSVVPTDYATIQDAIDSADSGDRICVQPGTYDEDLEVTTAVTLHGRTAPQSSRAAHLDGQIDITTGADGTAVRRLRISPSETFPGGPSLTQPACSSERVVSSSRTT